MKSPRMSEQVIEGVQRLASTQVGLGYVVKDPLQCFNRAHWLLGMRRQSIFPRFFQPNPQSASGPILHQPLVLLIGADCFMQPPSKANAATRPPGEEGALRSLPSGYYFRCNMGTHPDYAIVTCGPWINTGYRAAASPTGRFYICGTLNRSTLFIPGASCCINLLLHDSGQDERGTWSGFLPDGRPIVTAHMGTWLRSPIVGRMTQAPLDGADPAIQTDTAPAWTDVVPAETIPAMTSAEPLGLNAVLAVDESYEDDLAAFLAGPSPQADYAATSRLGESAMAGSSPQGGTVKGGGKRDSRVRGRPLSLPPPASFVLDKLQWTNLAKFSPLARWGGVSFGIRSWSKEYLQALILDVAAHYLPGGQFYEQYVASASPEALRRMINDTLPGIYRAHEFEEVLAARAFQFVAPIAMILAQCYCDSACPPWWSGLELDPKHYALLQQPLTWQRWMLEAIVHSTDQKIVSGYKDSTFQQGLVFAPTMTAKEASATREASYIIGAITFVLPLGLVGSVGRWILEHPGRTEFPAGFTLSCDKRDCATEDIKLGADIKVSAPSPTDARRRHLQAFERLVTTPYISQAGCDQSYIPNLQELSAVKIGVLPVHTLQGNLYAGGADWLRRLKESCESALELADSPLLHPHLLTPSVATMQEWLCQLRFQPNGQLPSQPPHPLYQRWFQQGTPRSLLSEIQTEIKKEGRSDRGAKRSAPAQGSQDGWAETPWQGQDWQAQTWASSSGWSAS